MVMDGCESWTVKKAGRRRINNLRYADDTTHMAESEEELKSFLNKVKEESEKTGLKLSIQKIKSMASNSITSWQIDWETVETVTAFIFLGSKITADADYSHEIKNKQTNTCSLEMRVASRSWKRWGDRFPARAEQQNASGEHFWVGTKAPTSHSSMS